MNDVERPVAGHLAVAECAAVAVPLEVGDDDFATVIASGQAMSREEATAEALAVEVVPPR
jgi:hypothetical protein